MQYYAVGRKNLLLRRDVDNNVDISEQFIGCTWCKVRISRDKGCFAGREAERDKSKICGIKWVNWFGLFICIVVPYGFGCSTALHHYFRLQCCVQHYSNTFLYLVYWFIVEKGWNSNETIFK